MVFSVKHKDWLELAKVSAYAQLKNFPKGPGSFLDKPEVI
jgi:hypothetical protein